MRVSDNHRRRFSSILTELDDALCEFERLAAGQEHAGVLYEQVNTLRPAQAKALREQVDAIRDVMSELKADLRLQVERTDSVTLIAARCASLWTVIGELDPVRLQQYGHVPAELSDYAGSRLDRIVAGIKRISSVCRPSKAAMGKPKAET